MDCYLFERYKKLINQSDNEELEQFSSEYGFKDEWENDHIAKLVRLETEKTDSKVTTFEDRVTCQIVTSVGLGTLQGLIAKMDHDEEEVKVSEKFVFKKVEGLPEKFVLSEGQVAYLLDTLLDVGKFYMQKNRRYGDFTPRNVSKKYTFKSFIIQILSNLKKSISV